MRKNVLVLERTAPEASLFAHPATAREVPRSAEYLELIRGHFHTRSAVAIVAVGSGPGAGDVCEDIAAELAVSGNRVVIVSVDALLRMNPVATPEESGCCTPGRTPNVWLWPSAAGEKVEFFHPRDPADPAGTWLDSLRLAFDSVLLDCPATETAPAAAQIAAMADAAMLVVEAGRTSKQQIQRDQRALQLRGVKLAGCILMRRR
jgi:Mrp family chromosome partitioning ATPase